MNSSITRARLRSEKRASLRRKAGGGTMSWLTKKEAAEYPRVCQSTLENMESERLLVPKRVFLKRVKKGELGGTGRMIWMLCSKSGKGVDRGRQK